MTTIETARQKGEALITHAIISENYYVLTKWKNHGDGFIEVFSEPTRYEVTSSVKTIQKKAKIELLQEIVDRLREIEQKKYLLVHIHSFKCNCEDLLKELSDETKRD